MLKELGVKVLDTLFPDGIKCIFCGRDIPEVGGKCTCEKCAKGLPYNSVVIASGAAKMGLRSNLSFKKCLRCDDHIHSMAKFCDRCQNHPPHFDVARAPFVYENPILGQIHALKYSNAKYLAEPFARYMADCYALEKLEADIIVPVPLHEKKLKQRGYNQAELLASYLSNCLDIPVANVLKRVKETPAQKNLGYNERRENIRGVFILKSAKEIKNKSVLLIDDVLTSGATADECSKLLKKHARRVIVLTVARTVI